MNEVNINEEDVIKRTADVCAWCTEATPTVRVDCGNCKIKQYCSKCMKIIMNLWRMKQGGNTDISTRDIGCPYKALGCLSMHPSSIGGRLNIFWLQRIKYNLRSAKEFLGSKHDKLNQVNEIRKTEIHGNSQPHT